jgi:hypothetical protein
MVFAGKFQTCNLERAGNDTHLSMVPSGGSRQDFRKNCRETQKILCNIGAYLPLSLLYLINLHHPVEIKR